MEIISMLFGNAPAIIGTVLGIGVFVLWILHKRKVELLRQKKEALEAEQITIKKQMEMQEKVEQFNKVIVDLEKEVDNQSPDNIEDTTSITFD